MSTPTLSRRSSLERNPVGRRLFDVKRTAHKRLHLSIDFNTEVVVEGFDHFLLSSELQGRVFRFSYNNGELFVRQVSPKNLYLFVPESEDEEVEYHAGPSVKNIMGQVYHYRKNVNDLFEYFFDEGRDVSHLSKYFREDTVALERKEESEKPKANPGIWLT